MDINSFSISISKEQLSGLPTVEFAGSITVLENMPDALEALRYLNTCKAVGFDTETKPNFRKGQTNTVSLIQISTLDHSFLFRLNKLGFFPELREFMESDKVTKVGLSLRDDFHVLHRIASFEPAEFIDLQNVVKSFHIADSSLQKIYGIIFNGRISKSQLGSRPAESGSENLCVDRRMGMSANLPASDGRLFRPCRVGLHTPRFRNSRRTIVCLFPIPDSNH